MTRRRIFSAIAFIVVAVAGILWSQQVSTLKPGQVRIVVTYFTNAGQPVNDTLLLNIAQVPIAGIRMFNQVNPPAWNPNLTQGQSMCVYVQALDSAGNIITGRQVQLRSTDTTVLRVSQNSACPDTTVDMTKVVPITLPSVPPQFRHFGQNGTQ